MGDAEAGLPGLSQPGRLVPAERWYGHDSYHRASYAVRLDGQLETLTISRAGPVQQQIVGVAKALAEFQPVTVCANPDQVRMLLTGRCCAPFSFRPRVTSC